MKQRSKPMRRLFYVPGLLSLVVLTPALMWFLNSKEVWKQERYISMTFPATPQNRFDSTMLIGPWNLPDRNWVELELSGGLVQCRQTRALFDHLAPRFSLGTDTVNGIHLSLASNAKWETVMAIVETLRADSVSVWIVDKSDIHIFSPAHFHPNYILPPTTELEGLDTLGFVEPFCGTHLLPPLRLPEEDEKFMDTASVSELLLCSPLTTWPVQIGLVVLVVLSLHSTWRYSGPRNAEAPDSSGAS